MLGKRDDTIVRDLAMKWYIHREHRERKNTREYPRFTLELAQGTHNIQLRRHRHREENHLIHSGEFAVFCLDIPDNTLDFVPRQNIDEYPPFILAVEVPPREFLHELAFIFGDSRGHGLGRLVPATTDLLTASLKHLQDVRPRLKN